MMTQARDVNETNKRIAAGACPGYSPGLDALSRLMNASIDELMAVPGIGAVQARSIYEYFHNKKNIDEINQLVAAGVRPRMEEI